MLPDAGPKNPFQYQLVAYLEGCGLDVRKAPSRRFGAVVSAVFRHRPDVLYFDWVQSFILGKTLLVTLLRCLVFVLEISYVTYIRRIPVVHTLHNVQNHAKRWLRLERTVYGWFLRRCDKIRVYSETTRRKIARFYKLDPGRILVIQDVPYHHYYPNQVSRREGRTELGIPDDAVVFLFLGLVKPYKGLEDLIAAFLRLEGEATYLVIAGASDQQSYGESLRRQVAGHPRIVYHNFFIDPGKVQYYYQAADAVVLPFKNVEHSGSVDLALSFGKPVITVNTPLLNGLLAHQRELLFNHPGELPGCLAAAPRFDLAAIGKANFRVVDGANYKNLILLFR